MNNAAIQFFALMNPGIGGQPGMFPGMNNAQGMTGLFQSMMGQTGETGQANLMTLQQKMTQMQGMGMTQPGVATQNSLMTHLPTLSVISTVQTLGLGGQQVRQTLEALMPQIQHENPKIAGQLTLMLEQTEGAENPDLALIQAMQSFIREQEINMADTQASPFIDRLMDVLDGSTSLFTDLAAMDLDEFKAFKENAFADMASFITQPKQVLGPDGRVREFLSGPSFLNPDHGNGASVLINEYRLYTPTKGLGNNPVQDLMLSLNMLPAAQAQMSNISHITNALPALQSVQYAEGVQNPLTTLPQMAGRDVSEKLGGIMMRPANVAQASMKNALPMQSQTAMNTGTPSGNVTNAQNSAGFLPEMGLSLDGGVDDNSWFTEDFSLTRTAARETTAILMDRVQAGRGNPITQNVATAMARLAHNAAAPGEKSMTIFMDPPELGRVEVQMKFGQNKTVKAHIMVEKPETYAMLQRDSQTLNRALTNLGLDTAEGADITFDLSHGENFDGSEKERGGQHALMNGQNATFEETLTILETTMDVYTDPETGLRHLNMVI